MQTGAYLLIRVRAAEAARQGAYSRDLDELKALPEVQCAELVSGSYDYVARVEAATALARTLDKVMEKRWVDSVRVLRVKPTAEASAASEGHASKGLTR